MGAVKKASLEQSEHEGYIIKAGEWVHEKIANGQLEDVAAKLILLQRKNYELKNYNEDILQALCMVAHVVKSFGFNNPAVQATRLDPDIIGDATKIVDEAFSILETPVLGRRVAHLVNAALLGKWEELEEQLIQEDK